MQTVISCAKVGRSCCGVAEIIPIERHGRLTVYDGNQLGLHIVVISVVINDVTDITEQLVICLKRTAHGSCHDPAAGQCRFQNQRQTLLRSVNTGSHTAAAHQEQC